VSKDRKVVTVLRGDGIGPEICNAAIGVVQAAQAPVEFETFTLPPMIRTYDPLIPSDVLARFFGFLIPFHTQFPFNFFLSPHFCFLLFWL
jgi:hypothetical protein